MKTAMQELIEDLSNNMVISIFERLEREGIFIKALEKEKQQIIGDYFNGKKSGVEIWKNGLPDITAEEYYNQTYNQNN